jgi:hypothetical protein
MTSVGTSTRVRSLRKSSCQVGTQARVAVAEAPAAMFQLLKEWEDIQEHFKGGRILLPGGINFAALQFVFAGYSGAPVSNRAFNLRLRAACRALGVGEITPTGCATVRPRSCLTTWGKVCGKSHVGYDAWLRAPVTGTS